MTSIVYIRVVTSDSCYFIETRQCFLSSAIMITIGSINDHYLEMEMEILWFKKVYPNRVVCQMSVILLRPQHVNERNSAGVLTVTGSSSILNLTHVSVNEDRRKNNTDYVGIFALLITAGIYQNRQLERTMGVATSARHTSQGLCIHFAVVRYWSMTPICSRVTSLSLGQSRDCPSACEVTLQHMGKCISWIHTDWWYKHDETKHYIVMCIFHGI